MPLPTSTDLPPILRGDSFTIPVAFTDVSDQPADLSGWTLIFTLKFHRMQPDSEAVLQKRQTVAGTEAMVIVTPTDTNELTPYRYEYDIQLSTPDGTGVRTFMMGTITLTSGVTHSIR